MILSDPYTLSANFYAALTGNPRSGLIAGEVLELSRKWRLTPKQADRVMGVVAAFAFVATLAWSFSNG